MSTNKNATIRYQALDRCFSNFRKRYYIQDLIDACNDALSEYDGNTSGVQRRQIFNDIKFMKDSLGYDAPIKSIRDGRKVYYRYSDKDFSINKQPLNASEAQSLSDALLMLSRFKGLPGMQWMSELTTKLETTFNLNNSSTDVVGFDQNIDLKGLEFFPQLFDAIVGKHCVKIIYAPFDKPTTEFVLSPYYLKQYNNRWFLFGKNRGYETITNVALDRIESVEEDFSPYEENQDVDFNDYFDNIVGVTYPKDSSEQKIVLKVADDYVGYFLTKPIHGSLKKKPDNVFELSLIPNYEFITYLFSHSDKIKVLEPETLKQSVIKRINDALTLQKE